MVVPVKDIFSDVPKAELLTLLILRAFDARVLNFLDIELRDFDNYLRDRQHLVQTCYYFQMAIYLRMHGRRKPAFVF